jgi:hypothetical protein
MASKIPVNIMLNPLDHPITPAEQEGISPDMIMPGLRLIGKLPQAVRYALGRPDQDFYFQNDGGKICLTRNNTPPPAATPARLAQRELMRQARAAWRALTTEQKAIWNNDQRRHDFRLPGYQFFIREYLRGRI